MLRSLREFSSVNLSMYTRYKRLQSLLKIFIEVLSPFEICAVMLGNESEFCAYSYGKSLIA